MYIHLVLISQFFGSWKVQEIFLGLCIYQEPNIITTQVSF